MKNLEEMTLGEIDALFIAHASYCSLADINRHQIPSGQYHKINSTF